MIFQFRVCRAFVVIGLAFSLAVVFHVPAFASGQYLNADASTARDRLNAVLAQQLSDALFADRKADAVLIDNFYKNASAATILRFRCSELPAAFFPLWQSSLSASNSVLQTRFPDGLIARRASEESSLHFRYFSMIPATAAQLTADELEVRLGRLKDIDIVEDVPVTPVLQDKNYFGVTQDASIIAVQVVKLFNDETRRSGDLDLYVGVNSLFNEDYEQQYGLLQAGQSFIAGIAWTF